MPGGEYEQFDEAVRTYMFLPFIQVGFKVALISQHGLAVRCRQPSVLLLCGVTCDPGCAPCRVGYIVRMPSEPM